MLTCTIPGPPVGKGRPRVTTRGGFARAYTPPKTAHWEGLACTVMQQNWKRPPLDEPLLLIVRAIGQRPKAMMGKKHPSGRVFRMTKPDGDNVLKAVGDALKNAGVVRDDVLIVEWRCTYLYAAKDEAPCVEIELRQASSMWAVL